MFVIKILIKIYFILQAKLSKIFPGKKIVVAKKADSIYTIVSAASICAKVIRDSTIQNWRFREDLTIKASEFGSGYPNGNFTDLNC